MKKRGKSLEIPIGTSLAEMERVLLEATLSAHEGDKVKTAASLGVSLRTVYNLMDKYGLRQPVTITVMREA